MKHVIKSQQGKAQLYFLLIVFINLIIFFVIVTGVAIGIKGYISDTKFAYEAVTCCGSVCSRCFFTLRTLATALPWICIAILFTGICMAIHKVFLMLSWNYRFISSITPLSIENRSELNKVLFHSHLYNQLVLFDNGELRYAFTSGLWNPKIYLSTGICSYLTAKELRTVILHETHHIRNNAPLKHFVLQILCVLNFFLPINRCLLNLYSSVCEKAADDAAASISGEPLELASALLKLSSSHTLAALYSTVPFSSRGQRITEDRIMRLLEPQAAPPYLGRTSSYLSCLLSLFIVVTICLSLFYQVFTSSDRIGCKTRVCHMVQCG
ncbi:MAG: hypothetical protein E3K36_10550 [Candidatus Brocadia sp.]|nr:hypothetical protein [Candidatus Brocadia sp.]